MDTLTEAKTKTRRRHSAEFKQQSLGHAPSADVQDPTCVRVALPVPNCAPTSDIRIELRPGATKVMLTWPVSTTEPLDMRSGAVSVLAGVAAIFGAARPHHAYLFANRRANRMKVLVHGCIGVWLAAPEQRQVRLTA